MPDYYDLRNKQNELIRKASDGSLFIAPITADPLGDLTQATGTGATAVIDLVELPEDWDDLGWLSNDGASFSREVTNSEVTSWGSVTPTRTDVVTDTSTLSFTAQETKMLTIGVATGVDLAALTPNAATGEVSVAKPLRPSSKVYRACVLAVDKGDAGDIFIARFLPRAKVSGFSDQAFGGGDEPISWGATLTGEEDSTLGYSERWYFGGPGWKALLPKMGFPVA